MVPKKGSKRTLSQDITIENRNLLLQEKLKSIEDDLAETGEMDCDECIKAMYLAFFEPKAEDLFC